MCKVQKKIQPMYKTRKDVETIPLNAIAKQKSISWYENINSKIAKNATRFVTPCRYLPCG